MKNILKKSTHTLLIVLVWLILFGLGAQLLLRVLDNEKLNNYFSYGLSTEAQLRNMFAKDIPDNSVLHAGWPEKDKFIQRGTKADITFYGMSFSNHIADQLIILNQDLDIRKIDGPAAPVNHSVSSFLVDKDICESEIVVLGVLDSSLKYINAMTNDTVGSDTSMGSFYPVFISNRGELEQIKPAINSFDELRDSMADRELWNKNLELLREYDRNYSPFIYKANILDYSISGRFIKRWLKSDHNKRVNERAFDGGKFNSDIVDTAKGLIELFLDEANGKGYETVVLLIETQKYGKALSSELSPFLDELGVEYLSTSAIVAPDNPDNFLGDGHMTVENDAKIAAELDKTIKTMLNNEKLRIQE